MSTNSGMSPRLRNGFGGGDKCIRDGQHHIPRLNAARHDRKTQGIRPAAHRDRVAHVAEGRKCSLEFLDYRTANEPRRPQTLAKCARQFALKLEMRSYEVKERNRLRCAVLHGLLNEAKHPGWVSGNNRVGRDILGDHAAGADDRILTNLGVGQNRDARTDGGSFADHRPFNLPIALGLQFTIGSCGARVGVIDEHDAMTDEDIVFDHHAFANETVTGDLAAFADAGILLNLYKCADLCLVPNLAAVQVYKLRESDIFTQFHVIGDRIVEVHKYTNSPFLLSDSLAVSSIFTTRKPAHPLLNGSCPLEIQSTK